jgi:hypothetical protein
MGLNGRLERRHEVVLPLGRGPARLGRLHRRRFARACRGGGFAARTLGEVEQGYEVGMPLVVGVEQPRGRREFECWLEDQ